MSKTIEDYQKEIKSLNDLLESAKMANDKFTIENARLSNANNILEAEKNQWTQAKTMQEQIIAQSINQSNSQLNIYLEQIQDLKTQIRGYKEQINK